MIITLDPSGIMAFMLVSLRLAVVMFATPLDAFGKVPAHVRLFWTLGFGFLLASGMDISAVAIDSLVQLAMAALHEVVIGLVLAFGLYTAFGAFQLAGRLVDFQAGFGITGMEIETLAKYRMPAIVVRVSAEALNRMS